MNTNRLFSYFILACILLFTVPAFCQKEGQPVKYIECKKHNKTREFQPQKKVCIVYSDSGNEQKLKGILGTICDSSFYIIYKTMEYIQEPGQKKKWTGKFLTDSSLIYLNKIISIKSKPENEDFRLILGGSCPLFAGMLVYVLNLSPNALLYGVGPYIMLSSAPLIIAGIILSIDDNLSYNIHKGWSYSIQTKVKR